MAENKVKNTIIVVLLFIATLYTTTATGEELMGLYHLDYWDGFIQGFKYSIPFLAILTVHEFGHYTAARLYKARVSLPYYIPFFPYPIGTLGAFIRIKSPLVSRKQIFDVGIAGPLAGFVVALGVLFYAYTHLPPASYIYEIHPDYKELKGGKENYDYLRKQDSLSFMMETYVLDSVKYFKNHPKASAEDFRKQWEPPVFKPKDFYTSEANGKNLILLLFEKFVAPDPSRIPDSLEFYHYPFLYAGFLALFFTALNLLPIGQLDGGHILYGLVGSKNHRIISRIVFTGFVYFGGLGFFQKNPFTNAFASIQNMLSFAPLYLYFLYMVFQKISERLSTRVLVAVAVFSAQFFTEYFFPKIDGFGAFLLFAFIIGRFLGLDHPPAIIDDQLDLKRKILGWLSLGIFVLCFTPYLMYLQYFTK